MRIAIVGGTAAGPAAAAEALRCRPDAEVVLYEKEPFISVGACEIPYLAAGWIEDWRRLEVLTPRQFEQSRGGTVRERHLVRSIDIRRRRLEVEALEFGSVHEEPFDRLILATGARPRRLGIEGEDAGNVFHIRTLDTARRLETWLRTRTVRHAVIVGGGYIGVEMAEALRARGIRVSILEPLGRVLGQTITREMGQPLVDAVAAGGVVVRQEAPVRFELDDNGLVRRVYTDRKEIIGCDLVLVSIGLQPNSELAADAGIRPGARDTIAIDEYLQTSAAGVFACGDNIAVPHVAARTPVYLPLAPVGRRAARAAARNASADGRGGRERFEPTVRVMGVSAFGIETAVVGLSEEEALEEGYDVITDRIEYWSRAWLYPGSKRLQVRLLAERGSGRLLGGELVGPEGAGMRANVLVPLIREGYTARRVLAEIDLLYNPPMAPAVDPLIVACSRIAKMADAPSRPRREAGK